MNEVAVFILAPVAVVILIGVFWAACQRRGGKR